MAFRLPSLILILTLCAGNGVAENDATADAIYHLVEGVYYLINEKQPVQAIPFFQSAIASDSTNPDPYYFLGAAYDQMEEAVPLALFYFLAAEERGVQYDAFRPNRIPAIQAKYPNVRPAPPSASATDRVAQIIVESRAAKGVQVVVQDDKQITKYELGDQIPLEAGKNYTIRLKKKGISHLLKTVAVVASVVGIWILR